jgi:hypothetical protein
MAPYMNSLYREFGAVADFAVVYVAEAHAQDEWPINSSRCNSDRGPVCVNAPATTEQRIELASRFASDFKIVMPVYADLVSDEFEKLYAPWPMRFYIFKHGRLKYLNRPENYGEYSISGVRNFLLEC